jgi:NADH-quinone oxidoreductase subunit C
VISTVESVSWVASVEALRAEGYDFFDWLGAADEIGRSDSLRVLLALRRIDRPGDLVLLQTFVSRDDAQLDTLAGVFAGAGWHEREAAELFGIEFVGGDSRRLLLDPGYVGTPLRKDEVLAARVGLSWPGAKEPGESDLRPEPAEAHSARRRMVPPGVPDPEVWGDRPTEAPAAGPAEVVAALAGGRTRRRPNPRGDTPRAPRGRG